MTDDRKSIVDYILAAQIERGDDIITAKPKTTIADLLALHDLDLGALAHKVGVTGDGFTTAHSLLLLGSYTRCDDDYLTMATDAVYAMDGGWMECARRLGALGAKVRAALSAPTIKVATPRVLQSADEAPCGSLLSQASVSGALRLWNGREWNLDCGGGLSETDNGRHWGPDLKGPVTLIAEGLTEAECRHLSGLSVADALAWCEQREAARRA